MSRKDPPRTCWECLHYEACQAWNIGTLVNTDATHCVNYRPSVVSVSTTIYDEEETHYPCTVQILRNSVTGEASIGWWEGGQEDD